MECEGEKGMFRTMRLFDLPCLEQRSEDIGGCVCVCVYAHSSICMWITEVQCYILQACKKFIQKSLKKEMRQFGKYVQMRGTLFL